MEEAKRQALSVSEVSTIFGVSPSTIYRWAHSGDVRLVALGRRRVLFPRDEIERVLRGESERQEERQAAA